MALIATSIGSALSAANSVPSTRLGFQQLPINVNQLKPIACTGLTLSTLITGAGNITGTVGNDLILAGLGDNVIDGGVGANTSSNCESIP